jgi:ectoine hydroxylase-related dioxygenase (phytanoyl-CoA dioxygenase family)
MLSQSEIDHYHEAGYVIPDFRLPEEALEEIRAGHDRLLARHPEFRDYCSCLLQYDLGFLNHARHPAILDMVEQLLGPNFALWNSSFFAKPAGNGKRTPWHQDGEYWPIRPLATCTVWIAVDAATPENGCLRVIRGSHQERRLRRHRTVAAGEVTLTQELQPDEYDERQAVDLVLAPGQVSLHDVFLLHGSEANTSARPRRGMTLRFMPTSSVFDRALAGELHRRLGITDHSVRTLYLMRGIDESGQNDFRLRH